MKKLLSILGAMTLIGTASTSVVACEGWDKQSPTPPTPDTRTNLNTIITKTSLDKIEILGTVPTTKELLKGIKENNSKANTLSESDFDFEGNPTATTATIEGKTNYKGKVTLTYQKDTRTNLNTITQLTGLDITADNNKTYNDWWDMIFKANELKDNKSIQNDWLNFVYASDNPSDMTNIKNKKQESGTVYIVIEVKNQNSYWKGSTPRLKVTLK